MYNLSFCSMNRHYGNLIGEKLGTMIEVNVNSDDTRWGEFLTVRVEIELNKPLVRGRTLEYNRKKFWIAMKDEKLPRYCFHCGRIVHTDKCQSSNISVDHDQYGSWLRADFSKQNNRLNSNGEQSFWTKNFSGTQTKETPDGSYSDLARPEAFMEVESPTVNFITQNEVSLHDHHFRNSGTLG